MDNSRRDEWEKSSDVYSANQVEAVLEYCGIEVVSDTFTHFLALCPFHGNTDSPAMAVDKKKGLWTCFSPVCMESGHLEDLPRRLKKLNVFQSLRIILKFKNATNTPFEERMREALAKPVDFTKFDQDVLDRMYADFKGSVAERYMKSRDFSDETLDFFRVGYSAKQNMVIVPMHDPTGMPIGLIGRTPSHTDKRFKNSLNLPKSLTAWNFHRARRTGDTVIICEASYDAMRVHQAGYPNVIALLGGHVTEHHVKQIDKVFSKVIVMTDFDQKKKRANCRPCRRIQFARNEIPCVGHRPGRDLGRQIVERLPHKKVMWAAYDDTCVYPHGAKDASDMTDQEIRHCLRNAISNMAYAQWSVEENTDELVAS